MKPVLTLCALALINVILGGDSVAAGDWAFAAWEAASKAWSLGTDLEGRSVNAERPHAADSVGLGAESSERAEADLMPKWYSFGSSWAVGGFAEWFSTSDRPGRLQQDGGWGGCIIDNLGLRLFGLVWLLMAFASILACCTGIMGLCAYSISVVSVPLKRMFNKTG